MSRRVFAQALCAAALWFGLGAAPAPACAAESREGSPAFERFRWSFFEDEDSARNGLDSAALLELEGEERSRAEAMLIRLLPDTRAIIGLGDLRSRRAAPRLQRLFNAERRAQIAARREADGEWLPYDLIYSAKALWQIRPDTALLAPVIEVLGSAELDIQRMNAAEALSEFHDGAAVRALTQALDDEAKLVRHHAARALLKLHGLAGEADGTKQSLDHMMYRSDVAARRAGGKADILAAIAGRPIAAP